MVRTGIGLIGVGRHGARYARHILDDFPNLRLAGIWRRDATAGLAQSAEWQCPFYSDYHELLAAGDVDAVVVVVPPTLHRAVIVAAAAAGKAVLLEKPAVPSIEDGRAIVAAVKDRPISLMVAQTLRFNGVVGVVRAAVEHIGRIHGIRLSQRFEPSRPGWIDDPAVSGGGVILHTGVHSFDLLRYLTGLEPVSVFCATATVGTARTEDNFVASIRMSDGTALASIAGSRATGSRSGPIELAGERGQIIADHVLNTATIVRGTEVEHIPVPSPVPTVRETLSAFVAALQSGSPMPISLADGLAAAATAVACYESARRGGPVEVPRFD